MKKLLVNTENPTGIVVDMSAEEIAQRETDITEMETQKTAEENAKTSNETLKASAKAKLIAGEALTEDEANTIVL